MNETALKRLYLACEIVWALVVGVAVTLVLTILRVAQSAPGVTGFLLRLGSYLLPGANGDRALADAVFVLISAVTYGVLAFVAIHLWLNRASGADRGARKSERRHGFRVAAVVPVFVYGWSGDEPFAEDTETVNVSEAGGLIPISAEVAQSQELILTNLRTEKDIACRVARLTTRADGERFAGLAFLQASPEFWEIEFVSTHAADPPPERRDTAACATDTIQELITVQSSVRHRLELLAGLESAHEGFS